MKLTDFAALLKTTGMPVARDEFPKEENPTAPYLVYSVTGSDNFKADNKVYHKARMIDVSIFTKGHADELAQATLEALFDDNDIPWEFESEYDHEQYDYEVVYSVEV